MQRKATHSVYSQRTVFLIRYRFDHKKKKKNLVLPRNLVDGQEDDTRYIFFEISQKLVVEPPNRFHNIGGAVGIGFCGRLSLSAEKCL